MTEWTGTPVTRSAQIRISTKITLLLSAVAILASASVGIITYKQFSQALIDHELKQLSNLADVKAVRLVAELETLQADALFASRSPVMQSLVRAIEAGGTDPVSGEEEVQLRDRATAFCTELMRVKPAYCQVRLIGVADGGREVVRVNRERRDQLPKITPSSELQKKGRESYFSSALKLQDGSVYLSDVNLNREQGRVVEPPMPVIRAATPLYDQAGRPVAVLVINRFFQTLADGLRNGLSKNHVLLVTNDRGDYLIHPDPAKEFGFDRQFTSKIQNDFPKLAELVAQATHDTTSIVVDTAEGLPMAVGICRVPLDPGNAHRFIEVAIEAPYKDTLAASTRSRNHSLLAGAFVMLIAVGTGYFLSRSVTEPLREIAAAAEAFGRGEKNFQLPVGRRDEIGVVARTLSGMMVEVQVAHADLNNRAEQQGESRRSALNILQDVEANRANALAAVRVANEQSARTQAILDGATDAIITIRPDGGIESFNGAAERMFGYSAGEVIGKNVNLLMPEPYHGEHDQYLTNYLETGISAIIGIRREVVGLRADGNIFPMDLAVSEIHLGDQRLFTGIARDVSELKNTMEQLARARDSLQLRAEELESTRNLSIDAERQTHDQAAKTQAILDGASDAIITISIEGSIESFNQAAERIFGYSTNEVVGKNINMLMPSPYHEEHDGYLHNYLTTGISKIIGIGREVFGLRKDGRSFPMHLAISDVKLGDRRIFTGIVRDITDLRNTMQQLTAANEELARRSQQIGQINFDLSRSNEELKQFAYVASHDLQEPLRKVTAFCQMLRDDYGDQLDENARTYIQFAVDGALRMKTLVQDLLAYSRVETQGKPLEPTDADDACAEAIDNLTVAIEESSAIVERDPLPVVLADRAQLIRLFQNVIGNAIKYHGDKPPRVHVSATAVNGGWEFRIRDNGIGIDPQYFERIFVIFQRLHGRDEYSGTGIGLAVCKRIVERAGGRIWVESQTGSGCEFCFTLLKSEFPLAAPEGVAHDRDVKRIEAAAH